MLLEVNDVRRSFRREGGSIEILKGISFTAKKGEFITLMGPSGSGKSTLLQIVGGLDRPTSGKVSIGQQPIDSMNDAQLSIFRRRKLGFVFQFFNLTPTLTAIENVALPALLDGRSMRTVRPRAMELLKLMGVDHRADNRPHQLSGGEMQRVALARALVQEPELILADEPTGNLDSKTGETVLGILRDLVRVGGQTVLMVTHDLKASQYGQRLIRIRDGQIESDQSIAP